MEKKIIKPLWYILVTTILIVLGCYLSYSQLGGSVDSVIHTISPGYPFGPVMILFSVIWLIAYRYAKKNRAIFKGYFCWFNVKKAIVLSLPIFAYALFFNFKNFKNPNLTLSVIFSALYAGICEDITWRALPASHIMKFDELDDKKILLALLLPAAGFACSHFSNIAAGSNVSYVLLQVFQTFGVGILFGAVYLRTGDMSMLFIIHVLNDLFSFMGQSEETIGIHANVSIDYMFILDIVFSVFFIVYGLFLARKSKRDEIREIWKYKWSKV